MKRDLILFLLPFGAALALAGFAVFLYLQLSGFESSYTAEAGAGIAREAHLAADLVTPLIQQKKMAEVAEFCRRADRDNLRLTLIDANGKVLADTTNNADSFGNHLDREEVQAALAGKPAASNRYSGSLDQWMIYYALPIEAAGTKYVLRAAISTDRVSRIIDLARLNMFWALLFGAEIVLVLALYIVKRVRGPLLALQTSVNAVAAGKLDTHIGIPESGIVRELAIGVSEMTEQLKSRLAEVTAERNEKITLLGTMSEAVLLFADDGELLRANPAAGKLFGFDPNGAFHLNRCRIPDLLAPAHRTLRTGEAFEQEFTVKRDGTTRSLLVKCRLLRDEGMRRLLLTATELTNLRKLESFRSDFVANVSHEIKTPLTCIVGAVEMLDEDDATLDAPARRKLLDMIKAQSARLNNLVQDILSLAALEKKQADSSADFAPVALDAMLDNAVNLCRLRAEFCGIRLAVTQTAPLTAQGDAQLLEQSVVNLIENAIKYSESKQIDISLSDDGRKHAVITVRDYGIGIAPEHCKRIFERFYRVDKSRSRALGGTGLGLAIVKHIAQLHKGTVGVESEPAHGSSFTITLPLT